jgi:hypothetical protein
MWWPLYLSFIAKQHVGEAIENSKNLTLHRDATTKLGRHFYLCSTYHVYRLVGICKPVQEQTLVRVLIYLIIRMNSKLLYNQKFYVLIASNKCVHNYWKKKTKTSNNEQPMGKTK